LSLAFFIPLSSFGMTLVLSEPPPVFFFIVV